MTSLSKLLKKGTRVRLDCGWEAVLKDNKMKSPVRNALVFGDFTEEGSIYVSSIVEAYIGGMWLPVGEEIEQQVITAMMAFSRMPEPPAENERSPDHGTGTK